MTKIIVADDHDLVRMGIVRMLSDVPGFTVVGEAKTGEEAVRLAGGVDAHRAAVLVVVVDPDVGPALAPDPARQAELVEVDRPRKLLEASAAADEHERPPPFEQVGGIVGRRPQIHAAHLTEDV